MAFSSAVEDPAAELLAQAFGQGGRQMGRRQRRIEQAGAQPQPCLADFLGAGVVNPTAAASAAQ